MPDTTALPRHPPVRETLHAILHESRGRNGHLFNFLLTVVILISVAIIPMELLPGSAQHRAILHGMEAVIVGLFTVEYLLRLYAAPNRWRYALSFFGIVDFLSIMPFYAGLFGTGYIRALRLVRLFKLVEIESAASADEATAMEEDIGLVQGEHVEHVVTRHPIVLLGGCIPPVMSLSASIGLLFLTDAHPLAIAISVSLALFAFLFLLKAWLDYSYDVIYVTNYRLIFHDRHLFGRSTNQINFHSITNVKPSYPHALSYVLRYGTLVIDTAAEHPGQVSLKTVRRHEQAAQIIMRKSMHAGGDAPRAAQ